MITSFVSLDESTTKTKNTMRISSLILFLAHLGVTTAVATKINTETKQSGDGVAKSKELNNQLQSEVKGIENSNLPTYLVYIVFGIIM